jgi:hypothetical protein
MENQLWSFNPRRQVSIIKTLELRSAQNLAGKLDERVENLNIKNLRCGFAG